MVHYFLWCPLFPHKKWLQIHNCYLWLATIDINTEKTKKRRQNLRGWKQSDASLPGVHLKPGLQLAGFGSISSLQHFSSLGLNHFDWQLAHLAAVIHGLQDNKKRICVIQRSQQTTAKSAAATNRVLCCIFIQNAQTVTVKCFSY